MNLIHPESLSETVDAVNEAFFFDRPISSAARQKAAAWIAGRQGRPGAYAGTFALFDHERRAGIRLFTGERATCASARHIVGQEACRVLRLLDAPAGRESLSRSAEILACRVGPARPRDPPPDGDKAHRLWPYRGGTYCCGPCSVGFWRHLTVGGYESREARLSRGLACLKACRRGDGQWRTFPHWYTLSALAEMHFGPAREEMRYAAARCESATNRTSPVDAWSARRIELARRVLAQI
jgi:hypothetical protein